MKDTSVSALLKHAQTGKPFINQKKFHLRSYINPPIDGKKDYPRKAKVSSSFDGVHYRKIRGYKEL